MPKRFKIKSYNKLYKGTKLEVYNIYFSITDSVSFLRMTSH